MINVALLALSNGGRAVSRDDGTGGRPVQRWFAIGSAEKAEKAEEHPAPHAYSASSACTDNGSPEGMSDSAGIMDGGLAPRCCLREL